MTDLQSTHPASTWQNASGYKCDMCMQNRSRYPDMLCVVCCNVFNHDCRSCKQAPGGTCAGCADVAARLAGFKAMFCGYCEYSVPRGEVWRCLSCDRAVIFQALMPGISRQDLRLDAFELHKRVCAKLVNKQIVGM